MSGFLRSLEPTVRRRPRAQFSGALVNRLTADWVTSPLSADQEIQWNLAELRGRSRELVRNVSWARRYVTHVANNVIGPEGILLQAQISETANRRLESRWKEWARPDTASVDGKLSWLDIQRVTLRSLPADGEVLLRMVRGFDNAFGFALQFLDPDQLDVTFDRRAEPGQNEIRMGVEVDVWGRPVAYHLWTGHPAERDGRRSQERVSADEIIHLGDPFRPNQTRYVPWFASVMLDLNMLRGYFEAELVAARLAATQSGFFVRLGDDTGPGPEGDGQKLTMDAEPGQFNELDPGLDFKPWTPSHPTEAFPEFTKALLRSIASGLGISYSALSQDLRDVNFSSIRAGILDERDLYRAMQHWIIEHLHERVYREWVRMAVLAGQLDARVDRDTYLNVHWQPRGWAWVDPEKDMKAAILGVEHGFDSRTRLVGTQGRDYRDVIDQRADEESYAREKGVTLSESTEEPQGPGTSVEPAVAGNGNGRLAALLRR